MSPYDVDHTGVVSAEVAVVSVPAPVEFSTVGLPDDDRI